MPLAAASVLSFVAGARPRARKRAKSRNRWRSMLSLEWGMRRSPGPAPRPWVPSSRLPGVPAFSRRPPGQNPRSVGCPSRNASPSEANSAGTGDTEPPRSYSCDSAPGYGDRLQAVRAVEGERVVDDDAGSTGVSAPAAATARAAVPVTRSTLVWFGLGFVLLSFFAAFLGSWLARSVDTAEPAPAPSASATAAPEYEEALAEILPAGSAVRAGSGAPEAGKGYEGDVYIDLLTADVYLFQDDWTFVGNIRASAAENLTGEQGPAGEQGAAGEQGPQGAEGAQGPSGAPGAPGAPGTQVMLGTAAPDDAECTADGDVFIDTAAVQFYECTDDAWVLFGPTPDATPEPSPETSE